VFAIWLAAMALGTSSAGKLESGLTIGLNLLALVVMSFGAVTILAARKMRRLESPELVLIGSILALVPLSPGWALGMPMGIWALLVLRKREVQAAFAAPKPAPVASFTWPRWLFGTMTAWALGCCLLGAALGVTPWATFQTLDFAHLNVRFPQPVHVDYRVLGFFVWPGLLASVLFLILGGGLVLARPTGPAVVRRLAGVLFAFFRVLVSLAGLALVFFILLLLLGVGPPSGPDALAVTLQIAVPVGVGLGLMASLFLPRAFWRPAVLLVTGLVLVALVGFWIHLGWNDQLQHHKVISSRHPDGTSPWDWQKGSTQLTPFPFLALACAAGLVLLGGLQFPRAYAAFRAGRSSTSRR
jgi:hypothetical protein